jgi:glycolate oxidase FAD binding subunit
MSALEAPAVARTLRPASPEEVADALAGCAAGGEKVLPVGSGRALSAAGAPDPCDVALVLDGVAGVVDYSPGDMTITVLAGTPLDTVRTTVAARGQRLPGLPEDPGTIGGLVAAGWTAAEARESQGTLRERLIGAQIADGAGRLTRSGGRVVKNVTGYDLHRMHVGAGGAFGVFTELTFRLEPGPEYTAEVTLDAPSWEAAREAWKWLRREGPEPAFLGLKPSPRQGLQFVALLEGDDEPARRAVQEVTHGWQRLGYVQARERNGGRPAEAGDAGPVGRARLSLAMRAAPSQALALFERLAGDGLALDSACYLQAGEICLQLAGGAEELTARLRSFAESARDGGPAYRVREESPAFLPPDVPRWSADPGALRLLARLKRALDPAGILRPGSYSAEALERAARYFAESR